jgi:hypothetical protein
MRQLTFNCSISSTMVSFITLNGVSITLSQSGTNWTGKKAISLDDSLAIAVTCTGVTGSPWSVAITSDCPNGTPAKIFSSSGSIPHGGTQGFTTSVKVAQNPCASGPQGALPEEHLALVSRKLPRKRAAKKAAKKTGGKNA